MASQTPRFNLDKYSQGDDNWSHSDTVDLLDELAVETDVIANRPTSGDYDDELFYATDQKLIYRWDTDQTDWLIEGGLGSSGNRLPSLWANTVNSNVTKHATDLSEDYTVDSGEGAVFAGPVTGTGSISGNGKISVIQEGHQFTDNVDAQGNDINNVGSLKTDDLQFDSGAYQDVSGSRSLTTWYQNTTSYPLAVSASIASGTGGASVADCIIDENTSQSDDVVSRDTTQNSDSSNSVRVFASGHAIIPPDHYYRVRAPAGGSLEYWQEQEVGAQ